MSFRDIWVLAHRNLKAGRKNAVKIVVGIGFALVLVYCFAAVIWFYADYKRDFQTNYRSSCYYYRNIDNATVGDMSNITDSAGGSIGVYGASEYSVLVDVAPSGEEICAGNMEFVVDGSEYAAKFRYSAGREYYQDIETSNSIINLGLYKDNMNVFPACLYDGKFDVIGTFPSESGQIMIDDYVLGVYGIETEPEHLVGLHISIKNTSCEGKMVCDDYIISGIIKCKEIAKREEKTYHDFHLEHIYINPKPEDESGFITVNGSVRYYFDNYNDFIKNCTYSGEILSMNVTADDFDKWEYKLTTKGMEISVLNWIMSNVGRLLTILACIVMLVIFFSLIYIVRFYQRRNIRYLDMLWCIGMEKKDRARLFNLEIFIMTAYAMFFAVYLSLIFVMLLRYAADRFLRYEFTVNPVVAVATVMAGSAAAFVMIYGESRLKLQNRD